VDVAYLLSQELDLVTIADNCVKTLLDGIIERVAAHQ
jgi:hypothetical protein